MNKKKSLAINTIILGIGTICSKGLSFLFVPLFSRWVSTSQYGDFDLYISYVSLIVPFMTLSTTEALFRFLVDEKEESRKKEIITNISFISLLGTIFVSSILLIWITSVSKALAVPFVFYLVSEVFYNFVTSYLRGIRKLNIYAFAGTINIVITFLSVFILVKVNGMGTEGMLLGYAIAFFVTAIIMCIWTHFWEDIDISLLNLSMIKEAIGYSLPMIPNSISWWIINVSDRTIIRIFLGSSFNGIYALANKIPSLCTTLFNVFHLSWQENISLTINDSDAKTYISRVYNQVSQTIISICLPILSLNFFMFKYIFSENYFDASYQVPILMAAVIVNVMAQFLGGIFVALKKPKWNGVTTVICAILNLVVHFLLINYIGLYAASVSTLVAFSILLIIRYIILSKKFSIKIKYEKKTIICIILYILFILGDMQHIELVNSILFFGGCIIFLFLNKNIFLSIFKKNRKRV